MNQFLSPAIFGEVLFDCFPDGSAVLGGAPFNVAWHLHGMGLAPLMITSVGRDEHGDLVRSKMRQWGMDPAATQTHPRYPTGQVTVSFNSGQPSYDIVPDQAYDHVVLESVQETMDSRQFALLYHGTLAMRTQHSKDNLAALIDRYKLPAFVDINLRAPWWNKQDIETALRNAKWIKLNEDELSVVTDKTIHSESQLQEAASALFNLHDFELLIVTLGDKGALCLSREGFVRGEPVPAENIVDTVGAGDSFSAVMIAGIIKQWPLKQALNRALAFASAVCQMRGATTMDRGLYDGFLAKWQN